MRMKTLKYKQRDKKYEDAERKRLLRKLDGLCSKYVRIKSSQNGLCQCFTCKKINPIEKTDCGHYISRAYYSHRWDFNNMRPQCKGCNCFRHGEPVKFREYLIDEIGSSEVEKMEIFKSKRRPPIIWLQAEIKKLQLKLLNLNGSE